MYDKFLEYFEKGLRNENKGIPITNYTKLGNLTANIQQSRYWLIGGASGTGKTSFVDDIFVIDVFDWFIKEGQFTDIKLNVIYNSMERHWRYKIAKWAVLKLYKDTGKLISNTTLVGEVNENDEDNRKDLEFVRQNRKLVHSYKDYFDKLFQHLIIYSGAINPTGLYKRCTEFATKVGEKVPHKYGFDYNFHNPNQFVFVINDHVGKLQSEKGLNDKGILDVHSEYMGILREKYLFTVFDIVQFNRNLNDSQRKSNQDMYPTTADFKGTNDSVENSDFILALFNPYKHNLRNFNGYNTEDFISDKGHNRFRSLSLLKNSYGADDIDFGLGFLGEIGKFYELPTAEDLKNPIVKNQINEKLHLSKEVRKFKLNY